MNLGYGQVKLPGGLGTSGGDTSNIKHVEEYEKAIEHGAAFSPSDYHKRTEAITKT